jgi:hypothetical protein
MQLTDEGTLGKNKADKKQIFGVRSLTSVFLWLPLWIRKKALNCEFIIFTSSSLLLRPFVLHSQYWHLLSSHSTLILKLQ